MILSWIEHLTFMPEGLLAAVSLPPEMLNELAVPGLAGRPAIADYWSQIMVNNSFTALLYPIQNTETL